MLFRKNDSILESIIKHLIAGSKYLKINFTIHQKRHGPSINDRNETALHI